MQNQQSFAVVGGDLRQLHLAALLLKNGYEVFAVGFDREVEGFDQVVRCKNPNEAVQKSRCVILPLPFTIDGETVNAPFAAEPIPLGLVIGACERGRLLTGGKLSAALLQQCEEKGIKAIDYYKREELEVKNTIPTAEGAIQIAMEELPYTLHGSRCLVTGFGRVGRMLAYDLDALGAKVSVCARKYSDLAWVETLGYTPVKLTSLQDKKTLAQFDIVFNTVPAVILTETVLSSLKKGCLVIDLASKPGGVDFQTAGALGIRTIWALSLPGKVAPFTAGAIICDTILNILAEEKEGD